MEGDTSVAGIVILLAPLVFAWLILSYPVGTMVTTGIVAIYLGGAAMILTPLGGLIALGAAGSLVGGGITLIGMAGILQAILRALYQQPARRDDFR